MKQLTQEQLNFVGSNLNIFVSSHSVTEAQRIEVYDLYNHIYETNKRPNGCGRCWRNTKAAVYQQYRKQTNVY